MVELVECLRYINKVTCNDGRLIFVRCFDDYTWDPVYQLGECISAVAFEILRIESIDLAEIRALGLSFSEHARRSGVSVLYIRASLSVKVEHLIPAEYIILYPVVRKLLEYHSADADFFGDFVNIYSGSFFLDHDLFCLLNSSVENIFKEYAEMLGVKQNTNDLYTRLFNVALEGDADCGGLLSYNYVSGEPVAGLADGRPLFVRAANDKFTLANFMRTQLYAAVGVLKIGNDILFKDEKVSVDRITGHGGYFTTKGVGQRILAAALNSPISVMETAGEGGAWGIALLASYCIHRSKGQSLPDFLDERVFAGNTGTEITPTPEDVAGFDAYIEAYKQGLEIEKTAVKYKAAK